MEKLIELLNEYEKDGLNEFEKYTERWYCEGTKQILCGKWENNNELTPYEIISKQYGFIKWLVENDKIDTILFANELNKVVYLADFNFRNDEGFYKTIYKQLLMLLSIQDNPIEFLISILN